MPETPFKQPAEMSAFKCAHSILCVRFISAVRLLVELENMVHLQQKMCQHKFHDHLQSCPGPHSIAVWTATQPNSPKDRQVCPHSYVPCQVVSLQLYKEPA